MLDELDQTMRELDRLINDPDVPMQAGRVWEILAERAGGFQRSYRRELRIDGDGRCVLPT